MNCHPPNEVVASSFSDQACHWNGIPSSRGPISADVNSGSSYPMQFYIFANLLYAQTGYFSTAIPLHLIKETSCNNNAKNTISLLPALPQVTVYYQSLASIIPPLFSLRPSLIFIYSARIILLKDSLSISLLCSQFNI